MHQFRSSPQFMYVEQLFITSCTHIINKVRRISYLLVFPPHQPLTLFSFLCITCCLLCTFGKIQIQIFRKYKHKSNQHYSCFMSIIFVISPNLCAMCVFFSRNIYRIIQTRDECFWTGRFFYFFFGAIYR